LKTFGGWRDKQLADGTGILAGHTPRLPVYVATVAALVIAAVGRTARNAATNRAEEENSKVGFIAKPDVQQTTRSSPVMLRFNEAEIWAI
jgi:hypothetical protein